MPCLSLPLPKITILVLPMFTRSFQFDSTCEIRLEHAEDLIRILLLERCHQHIKTYSLIYNVEFSFSRW